jgi:PAS domain S-box-containing protein
MEHAMDRSVSRDQTLPAPQPPRPINRLGLRLLCAILLFSGAFAILVSALQLFFDYRQDLNTLNTRLEEIANSYGNSLATALWEFDSAQINTQLRSIAELPDIQFAELLSSVEEQYFYGQAKDGVMRLTKVLIYHRKQRTVGTLTLAADLDRINTQLFERFYVILASQLIKTFSVSLFILFIFRRLVTRHLQHIAEHAQFIEHNRYQPIDLDRKPSTAPDELDQLVGALNHTQETLVQEAARARELAAQFHASEKRYRAIVETSQEGIWVIDAQNNTSYVNQRMADMLGYSIQDMQGAPLFKFMDDLAISIAETNLNRRRHGIAETHEFPLRHKNGQPLWTLMSTSPLYDDEHCYNGALKMVIDITERKRMEEGLRNNEERFRTLTEEVNLIPWEADAGSWLFTYVGPQAKNLLGYPTEAWYGEGFWAETIYPEDRERVINECANCSKNNTNYILEYRMRHANGAIVWIHDIVNVVRDRSGTPLLLRGFMIDITERKLAQEAVTKLNNELEQRVTQRTAQLAAANQELEAFSYSVSHDLRAPLRGIDGFSRILLEEHAQALDQDARRLIERVRAASQKMSQLIDDFLRLSRSTRGDMNLARVSLSELATGVAQQLQEQYPEEPVDIVIRPHLYVTADARLMRVALENLIGNAWKYSRPKEARRIEIGLDQSQDRNLYFVKDNGVGFDMEYASRLFTPFQRLHSDQAFEGSGVGLATVQRIINRHGGEIWAEASPDQGSTFYFTLPGGPHIE